MERPISPKPRNTDGPPDTATVKAVGHFATLLLTVLHREQALDMAEFADHLALFATITDESDPPAALALAYWASLLREAAGDIG